MDPNASWEAIAALATAGATFISTVALGFTMVRWMIGEAKKAGAREQREDRMATDLKGLEETMRTGDAHLEARVNQVEKDHNTVDKLLAVISEQMSGLRGDMGTLKEAVKGFEGTVRDALTQAQASKPSPRPRQGS